MKASVASLSIIESLVDDRVVCKLALPDCLVDADNILPHHTSGADVEMSDLGVSHEALWKTDSKGRGLQFGKPCAATGKLIHYRGFGGGNSIAILGGVSRRNAPTVNHD